MVGGYCNTKPCNCEQFLTSEQYICVLNSSTILRVVLYCYILYCSRHCDTTLDWTHGCFLWWMSSTSLESGLHLPFCSTSYNSIVTHASSTYTTITHSQRYRTIIYPWLSVPIGGTPIKVDYVTMFLPVTCNGTSQPEQITIYLKPNTYVRVALSMSILFSN